MNIKWSPSRLKSAEHCLAWYYYSYIDKEKSEIPTNPYLVLGSLFHSMLYNFYNPDGTPFFKSAKTFAGAAWGQWLFSHTNDNLDRRGKKIMWNFEGQKFVMKDEIQTLAKMIYNKYASPKTPRPVYDLSEHEIKTKFNGLRIEGNIDAFLPYNKKDGLRVVDYKTDFSRPSRERLEYDPQFGIYLFLVGLKLSKSEDFRKRLNYPEKNAKKLSLENLFLSDDINMQFDHLRSRSQILIPKTKEDIETILSSMEERSYQINSGNFVRSRGNHCVYCLRREKCESDLKKNKELILPGINQINLFPSSERVIKSRKRPQKTIRFPKRIAKN